MDRIEIKGPNGILRSLEAKGASPTARAEHPRPADSEAGQSSAVDLVGVGLSGTEAQIDHERVTEIRQAIGQGRYVLDPASIADAIIGAGFILRNEQ